MVPNSEPTIFDSTLKQTEIMTSSKKIIAFTDSVNECDCCGKSGLKGTFCVEIDGNEFYYGSTCTFKKHGFIKGQEKESLSNFNRLLYARRRNFSSVDEMEKYDNQLSERISKWAES